MKKIITLFFILILLSWSFFAWIFFWRNYNSDVKLNIKNINLSKIKDSENETISKNKRVIIDLHNIDDPRVIWLPSEYKVFFKR